MRRLSIALVMLLLVTAGCATLQQVVALRQVDFALDRVANLRLAGVELDGLREYSDLSLVDVGRLTLALSEGELPLDFNLFVEGLNPAENDVEARLVQLDWTLLVEDRETVSGIFEDEVVFRPGDVAVFPMRIELDLIDFFDGGARDLAEIALSLAGQGGEPRNVALEAIPTVSTAIGPVRYPGSITVVSGEVGGPR